MKKQPQLKEEAKAIMSETPFGKARYKETLGKGLVLYIIGESDMYIRALRFTNDLIPDNLREDSGWYSKKSFQLLALIFPNCFPPDAVAVAEARYRQYYPDVYEQIKGVNIIPTKLTSVGRHREQWYQQHANDWVEVCAWNDTDPNVEQGHVLIKAGIGGDADVGMTYFLVKEEEYRKYKEEYGFICQRGIHRECIAT